MATEPLAPAFSHGPDGQARPASAGKGGRPRPARATAKEEELLKELAAAMDGLSDDDEEEAPTPRPGLERRASAKGLDKDVPEQGE